MRAHTHCHRSRAEREEIVDPIWKDVDRLARELREERRLQGWTLGQAVGRAKVLGITLSVIALKRAEAGDEDAYTPRLLWALAQLYGRDYAEWMRLAGHLGRKRVS